MWLNLLALALVSCIGHAQQPCYDERGTPTHCQPLIRSFTFDQTPITNSTCGTPRSGFCERSISLGRIQSDCTAVCDASDEQLQHPPSYMTDFLQRDTRWQSENSLDTRHVVVIDLSFGILVDINLVAFSFESLIPANFRILKSEDFGQTYTDFHYFSTSCLSSYSIPPNQFLSVSNETAVLCQSVLIPPAPGQINFLALLGRPSGNNTNGGLNDALVRFVSATDLRVILEDHYLIPELDARDFGYYYALKDINVIGSCQCYGHGTDCVSNSAEFSLYSCVCQHNTTGTNCERCRDFYRDLPWQRANGTNGFECKPCNCNGHSNECMFDPEVYEETNRTSGGVCLNCRNNRAGRNCEMCASFFYPQEFGSSFACTACECNLAGILDDGDCARAPVVNTDARPGDCSCKANVQGRACDMCKLGYFNLSAENDLGCQECECSINGSVSSTCNPITGSCDCKPNTTPPTCDQCLPGFFQPDPLSELGCVSCNCNPGQSANMQCDILTGQCACKRGIQGRTCSQIIPDHFVPSVDYLISEGEEAGGIPSPVIVTDNENGLFTGFGFYGVVENVSIVDFGYLTPPVNGLYQCTIRYNLDRAILWESAVLTVIPAVIDEVSEQIDCGTAPEVTGTLQVEYRNWQMGAGLSIFQTLCLRGGTSYGFILSDFASGRNDDAAVLWIDSLVLIPVDVDVPVLSDAVISMQYRDCVDMYRSLVTQRVASPSCRQTILTVSADIYNGSLACECGMTGTVMGSSCMELGGQCDCLPGVRGRECSLCFPGTYNLTSSGCTSCSCNPIGSDDAICEPVDGNCTCLTNVIGRDCSSCAVDHWGLENPRGCIRCSCNATGSSSSQCDMSTGVCTCLDGVAGDSCDRCQALTYGFSSTGCSACGCHPVGSTGEECDVVTGTCSCLATTTGRNCSQCVEGTFNLQDSNPDGCQECFCSGWSTICRSASGFYRTTLSIFFNSSDATLLQNFIPVDATSGDQITLEFMSPLFGGGEIVIEASDDIYLEAPATFIDNLSYSQYLSLDVEPVVQSGFVVRSTQEYDVVIVGSDGVRIAANYSTTNTGFRVQLREPAGWVRTSDSSTLSVQEFKSVLLSVSSLLISISFDVDVIFYSIQLETAAPRGPLVDTSTSEPATYIPECDCPANYTGLYCELCSPGYTRMPSGTCELCQCGGFSENCDPVTGECMNCSRSTTGPSCNLCDGGTYGDPARGIECLPCPCPLSSTPGQFSDECELTVSGNAVCLNCPTGHTGLQCESCISGYFGDPTGSVSGTPTMCSDCQCSGNIDTTDPSSCDIVTGTCALCLGNTAGPQCERCGDGFYGDAVAAKNCSACGCNPTGSVSPLSCDSLSGQCQCLSNIVGQQCDQCEPNYYGFGRSDGCTPCDCSSTGSVSTECTNDGQCSCLPGVTGRQCDQCLPGFFSFSENGCTACSCSADNSEGVTCDERDGTCLCSPGATGSTCEECVQNFFLDNSRCAACPKCYQDIEGIYNSSLQPFLISETRIQNAIDQTSGLAPFNDRLVGYQANVTYLQNSAQELVLRQDNLTSTYNQQLLMVNVTLRASVEQTNQSLDDLKERFTTAFVIASSVTELMHTTLAEFDMALRLVMDINTTRLPALVNYTDTIRSNALNVNTSAVAVEMTLLNYSMQVEALQTLTDQILSLSSDVLREAESLIALQQELANEISETQSIVPLTRTKLQGVQSNLTRLEAGIRNLAFQLRAKNASLMDIPNPDEIRYMIGNITASDNYARNELSEEIANQRNRFLGINSTYTSNLVELQNLRTTLDQQRMRLNGLLQGVEEAYREARMISEEIENTVREANIVLDNLVDFNNRTFKIQDEVNAAMAAVGELNSNATAALAQAEGLELNLTASRDEIGIVKEVATNASSIVNSSLEEISSVNTGNIIASINASLQSSINALDSVINLFNQAGTELQNVQDLSREVAERRETAETVSREANSQSMLIAQTTSEEIRQLRGALNGLQPADSARLQQLMVMVEDTRTLLTANNVTEMYNQLRERRDRQTSERWRLEQELNGLRADIDHVRRINSALPNPIRCNTDGN